MKLLFVGDVVGKPGRKALRVLPALIQREAIDFTVVNIENAAGGFGVTLDVFSELTRMPVDVFTSGNHIWDKKEFVPLLNDLENVLRPANYPPGNPGRGWAIQQGKNGIPVGVLNLQGQVFMANTDSPFRVGEELLAEMKTRRPDLKVVLVDIHAEATSEKQAIGHWFDGRASLVIGTHTHVPTADARILPKGTAYQGDAGMTGAYEGIIGFTVEPIIHRFLYQTPRAMETATGDVRLCGAIVDVDETTGKAREITSIQERVG
ncbi:MAG: YmdB family metallophosphoesterase [Acidobacteria bacterium]|nr:YmdB family metallophosphoesterase [Acidobacteriota bacterium]MCG3193415.1 2',3'-cyclic-nucleotide 2'-phosphodiesterase [Thermoanaerobaculia bacterium]MCK6682501.1 YmdB family metallophosphoesterase [Thermoanaerobaculia bacterium]